MQMILQQLCVCAPDKHTKFIIGSTGQQPILSRSLHKLVLHFLAACQGFYKSSSQEVTECGFVCKPFAARCVVSVGRLRLIEDF